MTPITLTPIGVLHCSDNTGRLDTPKNFDESHRIGVIEIDPRYRQGLDGITAGSRIEVLCWLDRARRDLLTVHPRGDTSRPRRGVFATRSPVRPNPIGVSRFQVLAVDDCRLTVRGVDFYDETPVLDIKKAL